MAKAFSELASTPTQVAQPSLSFKKPPAPKKQKKDPEQYVFRLVKENFRRHEGESLFPPRFVVPNADTVLHNYGTESEPNYMPRQIRYVDGLKTIFVDEQEVNGNLPDSTTGNSRNNIVFENGHLVIPFWNKPLFNFLMAANQCEQNVNKMKPTKNVYRLVSFIENDDDRVELGKKKDAAYDHARNCSIEEMIPHAKFLGISFAHASTGEDRDYDAIREDYKAKALESPHDFLIYANNPRVKAQYIVQKALDNGIITTGVVKGQAHWKQTKQFICILDVSQKDLDAVTDFAMTEEGESFMRTLKAQIDVV
jgi:hypothetical protein